MNTFIIKINSYYYLSGSSKNILFRVAKELNSTPVAIMGSVRFESPSTSPHSPKDTKPSFIESGDILRTNTPVIAEKSKPKFDLPTTLPTPPTILNNNGNGDNSSVEQNKGGDKIYQTKHVEGTNNNNESEEGAAKKVKYELDSDI